MDAKWNAGIFWSHFPTSNKCTYVQSVQSSYKEERNNLYLLLRRDCIAWNKNDTNKWLLKLSKILPKIRWFSYI